VISSLVVANHDHQDDKYNHMKRVLTRDENDQCTGIDELAEEPNETTDTSFLKRWRSEEQRELT
jgi:hypothetical protein